MHKEIILVVDDNPQIADILTGSMLPSLGYRSVVAYDGTTALDVIRKYQEQLDLILMDLQLPDMTGLDLLRILDEEELSIPVILITGHGSEQVAIDAFRLGVKDYLHKPVDMDKLNAAISRALYKSRLQDERTRLIKGLREHIHWLTSISNVGRSVTSTLNLDEVLLRIVNAGVQMTRADQGFIALFDKSSEELYLRVVKNINEDEASMMRLPISDNLIGQVLKYGKTIRISRKEDNPLKVCTGMLVNSLIHVPLSYKGKSFGVLSVNNHTPLRMFNEHDESVLVSLAGYASIAIENANLYQQARRELAERKQTEEALRVSEERYALVVAGANDGIWDWNLQSHSVYYSPRWKSMLGYQDDEVNNHIDEWFNRIHPDDIERVKLNLVTHIKRRTPHFMSEYRILSNNGEYRWVLTRGLAVWDDNGSAIRLAGSQNDITDRKRAEQQLLHDALHDALTDLPNRNLLIDRLEHAIERSKRNRDYKFVVLLLDLDHFKNVNDSLGHLVGDQLLVAVSRMLRSGMRAADTLARFGGDEFVILLEDVKDFRNVSRITNWIHKKFQEPFQIQEHEVFITTSIGAVQSRDEKMSAEDMLRDADIAMYVAKANGRARTEIFKPSMRDNVLLRLTLETELRGAVDNNELEPYYQPIVLLDSGKLIGFEALARWNHPRRGTLNPDIFIPLAEETGMIIDIDRWILKKSCYQMQKWQKMFNINSDITISVNISGKHLKKPGFVQYVKNVLEDSGLLPKCLKIEITERSVVESNKHTEVVFDELRQLGVQLQIDDFGIGYSSLGYLSHFPIDGLKIDSSFVSKMLDDESQEDIVQTIVMLTDRLNIHVIAEGIETVDQLDKLRSLGCEIGQGFLVAKPLKKKDAEYLLMNISNNIEPRKIWALLAKKSLS